jgi:adenine-specific DNA-methyltransferase
MTQDQIKLTLENPYARNNWVNVISNVFNNGKFNAKPVSISLARNEITESAFELGSFETADERLIGIYEVKIKGNVNLERNRVRLRHLLKSVYKQVDGAFIVFDQDKKWRFSYVSEVSLRDKNGNLVKSTTEPKRYTYLFGEGINNRTAIERFHNLSGKAVSLQQIKETFSVDSLTKEFYKELSDWYFWALQHVDFPDDEEKNKEIRNATNTIRLITRLIFVWFLKQKKLIPNELFDKDEINRIIKFNDKKQSTFYKAIMQNLFFATLNTEMSDTKRKFVDRQFGIQGYYRYKRFFKDSDRFLQLTKNIPFLNGGLFENLDKNVGTPNEKRIDCFSNRLENEIRVSVPDFLFFGDDTVDLSKIYDDKKRDKVEVHGLINILKKYNFTIEENTPLDVEVALDPELLGKVFENLLASYNPETQTTARKQTGSFYTPREIVDYMVDESLKAYFLQKLTEQAVSFVEIEKKKTDVFGNKEKKEQLKFEQTPEKGNVEKTKYEELLNNLLSYSEEEHKFSETEIETLISALDNCKIIDPACGSGAYPMGVLHKMVHVLHKLDPKNKLWKEKQIARVKGVREAAAQIQDLEVRNNLLTELERTEEDIEKSFANNELDYGRKLYLIENCIYGIDIQPIAVQIAKLRFFISLVVDQTIHNTEDNLGIRPLPNLETKFVAANTLINLEKENNNLFTNFEIDKKKAELKRVRLDHFEAKTPRRKARLRKQDEELREAIADLLVEEHELQPKTAKLLANWNPYDQNASAAFFDYEWMFGIKEGFDIIIGNPPYIQLQKMGKEADLLQKAGFQTFMRTGDIYCLFYELGVKILKPNGILSYITSNQWMRTAYGEKLRSYFINNTNPLWLIDFSGYQVFDAATVNANILIAQKSSFKNEVHTCALSKDFSLKNLSDYFRQNSTLFGNLKPSSSWVIMSRVENSIKNKIEALGKPLKDWAVQINYGIKTGYNEAFIIDDKTRNKLLKKSPKSEEIIRPILLGKSIKRYSYSSEGLWLINSHNGIKSKAIPRINLEADYPSLYEYLCQFKSQLNDRLDQGDHWSNLRNCAYLEEFNKPKIAWGNLSLKSQFAFVNDNYFINAPAPFFTSDNLYLLGVLNSLIGEYYIKSLGVARSGGYIEFKPMFVEQLPVPQLSLKDQKPIHELVSEVLIRRKKSLDTQELEKQIDSLVFDLYGLSKKERETLVASKK